MKRQQEGRTACEKMERQKEQRQRYWHKIERQHEARTALLGKDGKATGKKWIVCWHFVRACRSDIAEGTDTVL